ncbi:MAG: alpha/beta hydrolase [Candidatus Nanopelagicales bacterium]
MSTPPFIAMPDGVALSGPPSWPAPVIVADPTTVPTAQQVGGRPAAPAHGSVLLVPGFTGSKEDFIAVLVPLAALGWRVAAMDLPGQAGFPGLGPRGSHTPAALAEAVLAVLDRHAPDAPVHVVGHSMGGLVTRELVLGAPDRLASWTALCSGPAALPAPAHGPLAELRDALAALPIDQVWQLLDARNRADGWTPPSAEVATFLQRRFCSNDPAALADFAGILMEAPDLTGDLADTLAQNRLPAAIVTGELDDAWPVGVQEQMAAHLGVPWHLLAGVGHSPAAENPAMTVAVMHEIFSRPRTRPAAAEGPQQQATKPSRSAASRV